MLSEDSGAGSADGSGGGGGGLRKRLFARGRAKKQAAAPTGGKAAAQESKSIHIMESSPALDQTPVISNKSSALTSSALTSSGGAAASSAEAAPAASSASTTVTTSTTPVTHKKGILKNKSEDTPIRLDADAATKKRTSRLKKASWFCRTAYFSKLCDTAFDGVDSDRSGCVDVNELYSGLLLIHLKLGTYAGPAACRPLSRDRCQAIFEKMDADRSGTLDRDEFRSVMMVLFSNVVLRVFVQWSMTLLIVPVVAKTVLDVLVQATRWLLNFVASLDEDFELADEMELTMEAAWDKLVHWAPEALVRQASKAYHYLAIVPASVWEALPLTILSTILGIVVVPWCIFQVDDFFQTIADRRAAKSMRENSGAWI